MCPPASVYTDPSEVGRALVLREYAAPARVSPGRVRFIDDVRGRTPFPLHAVTKPGDVSVIVTFSSVPFLANAALAKE